MLLSLVGGGEVVLRLLSDECRQLLRYLHIYCVK